MSTEFRTLCAELVEDICYLIDSLYEGDYDPCVLTKCRENLWNARAALNQTSAEDMTESFPEPREPELTNEEIDAIESQMWKTTGHVKNRQFEQVFDYRDFARVMYNMGRNAPKPVPKTVREQQPSAKAGDLDDNGRCWFYWAGIPTGWRLDLAANDHGPTVPWLPHWALPVLRF